MSLDSGNNNCYKKTLITSVTTKKNCFEIRRKIRTLKFPTGYGKSIGLDRRTAQITRNPVL